MDDKLTQYPNCQAAVTFVIATRSEPFTGHSKEGSIWKVLCTRQKMQMLKAETLSPGIQSLDCGLRSRYSVSLSFLIC